MVRTALGAQAWGADTFGEVKFTIENGQYCVTLGNRTTKRPAIGAVLRIQTIRPASSRL
jgi:hypothetical protein